MTVTTRRWLTHATAITISTGAAVSTNIATNQMSNPWAWVLVGVVTVCGIVVGAAFDKWRHPSADADGAAPPPPAGVSVGSAHVTKGTANVINGDKNRVKIVSNSAPMIMVVGLVVIVAVVAGMLAGGADTTTASDSDGDPAGAPPFALTVITDPQDVDFGTGFGSPEDYVFPPGSVPHLPPPEPEGKCFAWQRWAEQHGGVRAKTTRFAFTVSAVDHPVRLHGARLVVERQPGPATGDILSCAQGGPTPISHLDVDLDNETTNYSYPDESPDADQSRPLALDIAPGRSERVAVSASSRECYCRWYLELQLESQGKAYTRPVKNNGRPFVTAPLLGQYTAYVYSAETGRWEEGVG